MIVQQLHQIQNRDGYLSKVELRALAARTGTRLHRLQEVASFFPHFRTEPPPDVQVKVCQDMSCHLRGSCELLAGIEEKANSQNAGPQISISGVSCLGRCDRAPVASVATTVEIGEDLRMYTNLDNEKLAKIIDQTSQAVAGMSSGSKPGGESDVDWQPDQHKKWNIDIYRDKPDDDCYSAVRMFILRTCTAASATEESSERGNADELFIEPSLRDDLDKQLGGLFGQLDVERQRVIAALYTAGLLGMGGAGGRAYKKWFDVHKATGDAKYVVCNADESEPGTFKDREILLRTPHLVLEGVILAGLLLGASNGYIYIRHEFEEQIETMRHEISRAQRLNVCGDDILGSGVNFSVEVFVSPGGYICGEQTALIEAMEDKRAEPRNRPPELQTNGLWDKPTLLNNVETLAWVPAIVSQDNGQWFADQGIGTYAGRRFFSISGNVNKPGAYEVPIGITLGQLIDDYAGGIVDGSELKAVALSGPSGGFLPRRVPVEYLRKQFVTEALPAGAEYFDILNMELDIDTSRTMGVMMGAGMVVFDENVDMVAVAASCSRFFRNESCGKCVPCRIGSQKLVEILNEIIEGKIGMTELYGDSSAAADARQGQRGLIQQLGETMKLTAICGLGTVAPNPVISLLDHFRADVEKYVSPR